MKKSNGSHILFVIFTAACLLAISLNQLSAGALSTAATVVINEVAWMGTTASFNDEWIELFNNSGSPVNMSGWTLSAADGTPSIALNGTIPAGGYYLLERTDDTTVPGVAADQIYTGSMGNDGEDLILRDGSSIVVDQVNASTGWFAGHNDARVPMFRIDPTMPGNLQSNWTYNPRCGSATNSSGVSHTCVLTTTNVLQPFNYSVYFNDWRQLQRELP